MTKQVREYLVDIEKYLTDKYGTVNSEWKPLITLLADNLELYTQCKATIKQHGIYDATTGKKNPLLATMKDLQATIIKQIQHLGLSPYAASKIKETVEDDTDDFIENLTN